MQFYKLTLIATISAVAIASASCADPGSPKNLGKHSFELVSIDQTGAIDFAALNAPPVHADNGLGVSDGKLAVVRVIRPARLETKNDPLASFGAGFTIVTFNKGSNPVIVGPDSIVVKNEQGQILEILTADKIAAMKAKRAEAQRTTSMLVGLFAGMAGAAGAASSNAVTAANGATLMATGLAVAEMGNNSADASLSQTAALTADYNSTPLVSTPLQPLSGTSGCIRVNGLKDRDPAIVIVTVAGETHEIDFAKGERKE